MSDSQSHAITLVSSRAAAVDWWNQALVIVMMSGQHRVAGVRGSSITVAVCATHHGKCNHNKAEHCTRHSSLVAYVYTLSLSTEYTYTVAYKVMWEHSSWLYNRYDYHY